MITQRPRLARPIVRSALGTVALVALLTSCSSANKGSSLAGHVDIAPPTGYAANAGASGSLDKGHAAIAMPYTVTADAKSQLGKQGYKRGNVKVWNKGTAFASATALRVKDEAAATALVAFEKASIQGQGDTTYVSDFPPIEKAQVFIVSGVAKSGDQRGLFCQGVFFSRADVVYIAMTCDSTAPASTAMVTAMSKQLLQKAGGGVSRSR